jgi:hypothetical protein
VALGGSSPAVAFSSAGVFGVAWKAINGDILYNAVTPTGTLRLSTDKTVVTASGQSPSSPRLASLGDDLVVAYGRRDTSGAQAAVVRLAALTGASVGAPATGMNIASATAAPEIGGVAVRSSDGAQLAVISRPPELTPQATVVDAFTATPTFVTTKAPSDLAGTRTSGIGWGPGRFIAGAVTDGTNAGGTLLELDDTNLTPGTKYRFTGGTDLPTIGASGATVSIARAGDRVAVAWVDSQSTTREVWIATVSLTDKMRLAEVQASVESMPLKSYPHVVFDGAAFVLVWLEGDAQNASRLKLARFDINLVPVGTGPMNVGPANQVTLADIDVAAAAQNVYGVVASISTSTKQLFYITCN